VVGCLGAYFGVVGWLRSTGAVAVAITVTWHLGKGEPAPLVRLAAIPVTAAILAPFLQRCSSLPMMAPDRT
jgi:hypothetical protein